MKKSNENLIPVEFSPVDDQYRQFAETFHVTISLQFLLFMIVSSLANQSTILGMGKTIHSTFPIMERLRSTFTDPERMD